MVGTLAGTGIGIGEPSVAPGAGGGGGNGGATLPGPLDIGGPFGWGAATWPASGGGGAFSGGLGTVGGLLNGICVAAFCGVASAHSGWTVHPS